MTLFVEAGAHVLFHQEQEKYPVVLNRWEGVDQKTYAPLLYGDNLKNIAISGRGTLDGQGEHWWKAFKAKEIKYPRPRFVGFLQCERILIEGVKFVNSPSWTINPVESENITIDGITILNPSNSPNTDGIDPESCKNIRISNCHIDVGDDCIAIKAGTEECSKRIPCENITITNCTMVHGHGGVVLGSEMSGTIRNVTISNCVFEGTDRGIRMKSRRGRGGAVEDVRINNIIMKGVFCPFVMNLYYYCGNGGKDQYVWDKNPYPVDERTPAFRRVHFNNIEVREAQAAAGFMYGLAEQFVEDVSFTNVSIHMANDAKPEHPAMMDKLEPMAKKGFFCSNSKNVKFNNVTITNQEGPAFTFDGVKNISMMDCFDEECEILTQIVYNKNDKISYNKKYL
jgi:polygalacturonase